MKNGMDADIKSMTQAEKAMLRYQYVLANTTAAQGDFARTADTWANQVRILKQNFQQLGGIIGGALINAFKPFLRTLNFVMQKVISFATTVTNALGAIFGWKFEVSGGGVADDWSDAASSADDLADSTGKAADNTKKMKNNLLAIDELNVLNPDDSDAGSGGSGSGSGGAGGGAGGLVQADTIWKDFESNIKDLYQLGEYIRDALIGAMESIDWDSIYEKARNFGTGLAQFLNGLFADANGITLFGEVGKTIASALNTVIYAALAFGQEFDFTQFGYNIADGINHFFETFDFASLAETLNVWANGILNAAQEAVSAVHWNEVFKGIGTLFFNLDATAIVEVLALGFAWKNKAKILKMAGLSLAKVFVDGIKLSDILVSITKLSFVLPGTPAFDVIASRILDTLSDCLRNLIPDWAFEALSKIGAGLVLGAAGGSWLPGLGTIAGAIIGGIVGALDSIEIDGQSIIQNIFGKIFNFDTTMVFFESAKENFKKGGLYIILGIIEGIEGAISLLLEPIADVFTSVIEFFCNVFGIHSPAETMKPIGENIIRGIIVGFSETVGEFLVEFQSLATSVTDYLNEYLIVPVVEIFTIASQNIENLFSNAWIAIQGIWSVVSAWFNSTVIVPTVNFFTTMKNNVTNLFKLLWTTIQNIWIVVSSWFNNNVIIPTVTFFTKFYEKVKKLFSDLWSNVQEIWSVVSGWFSDNVITPVSNSFSQACANIASYFENLWKNVKNGVVGAMNVVIQSVEKAVNGVISMLNTLHWEIPDWVPELGGKSFGFHIKPIALERIPMYEVGGFPEDGLFFANHNEMVGQFSNGRTAVANNEQIVAGIREGVKAAVTEALAPYLSEIADNTRETAEKDASINVDGRELVNAINSRISRNGFSFT